MSKYPVEPMDKLLLDIVCKVADSGMAESRLTAEFLKSFAKYREAPKDSVEKHKYYEEVYWFACYIGARKHPNSFWWWEVATRSSGVFEKSKKAMILGHISEAKYKDWHAKSCPMRGSRYDCGTCDIPKREKSLNEKLAFRPRASDEELAQPLPYGSRRAKRTVEAVLEEEEKTSLDLARDRYLDCIVSAQQAKTDLDRALQAVKVAQASVKIEEQKEFEAAINFDFEALKRKKADTQPATQYSPAV